MSVNNILAQGSSAAATRRIALVVLLAALAAAPLIAPPFWVTLLNYIGLYSIVALGLVLLTGVAGQTSFGQAAFVGIGAYVTAYLSTRYAALPWMPWLNLLLGLALDGGDRALPRLHHAAHARPLPAAGDHCLGHQLLFPLRQPRVRRRPHRPERHSRALVRGPGVEERALLLLSDLDRSLWRRCG